MTPDDPTNDEQEQVRRLLASAGEPEEMPADVRARLDDVLAGLVAERSGETRADEDPDDTSDAHGVGAPVSLAARRRRRWPKVLLAAAAVCVVAYGAGVLGLGTSMSGDDSMSSADGGGDAGAGQAFERSGGDAESTSPAQKRRKELKHRYDDRPRRADGELAGVPGPANDYGQATKAVRVPRLHSATLRRDVRGVAGVSGSTASDANLADELLMNRRVPRGCDRPDTVRSDTVVAVRLDGTPATLVLHKVTDGKREADVYSCGDVSEPVARTTVPAP